MASTDGIKAVVQPRIHSSKKANLEDVVPLRTPFSVHIDVCSYCNFKCSFCFQADIFGKKNKKFPHGMMKMDLFKKISKKYCNHQIRWIRKRMQPSFRYAGYVFPT